MKQEVGSDLFDGIALKHVDKTMIDKLSVCARLRFTSSVFRKSAELDNEREIEVEKQCAPQTKRFEVRPSERSGTQEKKKAERRKKRMERERKKREAELRNEAAAAEVPPAEEAPPKAS